MEAVDGYSERRACLSTAVRDYRPREAVKKSRSAARVIRDCRKTQIALGSVAQTVFRAPCGDGPLARRK